MEFCFKIDPATSHLSETMDNGLICNATNSRGEDNTWGIEPGQMFKASYNNFQDFLARSK